MQLASAIKKRVDASVSPLKNYCINKSMWWSIVREKRGTLSSIFQNFFAAIIAPHTNCDTVSGTSYRTCERACESALPGAPFGLKYPTNDFSLEKYSQSAIKTQHTILSRWSERVREHAKSREFPHLSLADSGCGVLIFEPIPEDC